MTERSQESLWSRSASQRALGARVNVHSGGDEPVSSTMQVNDENITIFRGAAEAAAIGCSRSIVVPINEVREAVVLRGPKGSAYVRIHAAGVPGADDIDKDPYALRFERRLANEARKLARVINIHVSIANQSRQRQSSL